MDLSEAERAQLKAIRDRFVGQIYVRDASRSDSKAEYRLRRRDLEALRNAWGEIDSDTQEHITAAIYQMWQDDGPFPDLSSVVSGLLHEMEMPSGRPEELPGLSDTAALLWSIWSANRPFPAPIDREALRDIGAHIATQFGIAQIEAERRVGSALRNLDKEDQLPNRKGYGT